MRSILKISLLLLLGTGSITGLKAQGIRIPQSSSGQTIIQDFGLGKITVKYFRPNTKGRKVFTELAPYGSVWRTGANNATVITFTDDVTFEGHPVPAGQYALFTIPGKDEWTVILNKTTKQWGAYEYKEAEDFLRVKVKPANTKQYTESFTIGFANVNPTKAQLQLLWEQTSVSVNLTTDIDAKVMASIDEAMKGEKKPYFQASMYYYDTNKDLDKALEWMKIVETTNQKSPAIKLYIGRIQLKMGDKKAAAESAEAGLKLADEAKDDEYARLNKALLAEIKK